MSRRPPLPGGPYLVVGLARSGTAAALALRGLGEEVIGVDCGEAPGAERLVRAGVGLDLGHDGLAQLERAQTVVKSPGVPGEAPVIDAARRRGLPVLGELELGWRLLDSPLIAVTGTNGKTTTVELIGHLYRKAGQPVAVAGNVGIALSSMVGEITPSTTVVCEASSFQLEDTLAFAPEAALLLNLTPDHLDRHASFEGYEAAKLSIFARQREGDLAVLPAGLAVELRRLGGRAHEVRFGADAGAAMSLRAGELWWRELDQPLLAATELSLRGAHNIENALAAAAVCLARGLDPDAVRAGLRDFPGVPHRLEEVGLHEGVLYVNDSKATNVASTRVALRAFCAEHEGIGADQGAPRVHLILGGQAKGQSFEALRAELEHCCRAVYLIGEDARLIAAALRGATIHLSECGELERATAAATQAASAGEVVLLSPGCSSFDQFADFEARGERFRELVNS